MAIQDDNTILNKGDLKAYHEAIAPMLGGTLLSRTNVSDHYSTDEKIVGVWTDGKPLYQKTIFYDLTNKVSSAYYDTIIDSTITDSNSHVVSVTGGVYIGNSYKQFNVLPQTGGANNRSYAIDIIATGVRFTLYESNSSVYSSYSSVVAIVQYTKTTDAAGSATATPGAYDINFPNTWPANTEIYFGNGLYGYRKTGSASGVGLVNIGKIGGLTKNGHLLSHGGYLQAPNSGNWDTGYFSVEVDDTSMIEQRWSSSSMSFTYNIWVTYTK